MDTGAVEQRLGDLKTRLAKLSPEDRERALDGFAQVVTLCEMRREGEEAPVLSVTLKQPPGVTTLSG